MTKTGWRIFSVLFIDCPQRCRLEIGQKNEFALLLPDETEPAFFLFLGGIIHSWLRFSR